MVMCLLKLSSVIEDLAKQTGHDLLLEQISLPKPAVTSTSTTKPDIPHDPFTGGDDEIKDRIISMEKRVWDLENRVGVVEQRGGKRYEAVRYLAVQQDMMVISTTYQFAETNTQQTQGPAT